MTSSPREMHGDNLQRIGIKFLATDMAEIRIRDFVPVFHTWIQKQNVEGHLLVDVHDYSHIHNGPGILLVAHEGNFSMDQENGRMGLFYYRKQPLTGSFPDRLRGVVNSALKACAILEDEPVFQGKLRFRTDDILFVANDRLAAPNDQQILAGLRGPVSEVFGAMLGGITLADATSSPQDRLSISIRSTKGVGVRDLLG